MLAKHLETSVRLKPGGAVLDLHGEINGFAQEALNAAYTEAEAKKPGDHPPQLRGGGLHRLGRARLDWAPACEGACLEASPSGLRP
jgi:hypothetical protein